MGSGGSRSLPSGLKLSGALCIRGILKKSRGISRFKVRGRKRVSFDVDFSSTSEDTDDALCQPPSPTPSIYTRVRISKSELVPLPGAFLDN